MLTVRSFTLVLGLAGLAFIAAPSTPAQAVTPYDPPSMTLVQSGFFNVILEVRAGASGAPAGFTLQWMTLSDYQVRGGWPTDPGDPALRFCDFTGDPTLHLSVETASYRLPSGAGIRTEPGDLFDATGVATNHLDILESGTPYVFRAFVRGDENGLASDYSGTLRVSTFSAECTQGFWKNHPDVWPPTATPMLLGTVSYTAAQLMDIFQTPAQGNGLVSLAHQLIATKLNLANGSDPLPLGSTIADADALIGGQVVPPVGAGSLDPQQTDALTQVLDNFNNGRLGGVLPCPTAVPRTTWGMLKALYR